MEERRKSGVNSGLSRASEISDFFAHSADAPMDQWQLLRDHLSQVADLAAGFASHFNLDRLGALAGLLHDLGKYSIPFQDRLRGAPVRVDHSTHGAKLAIERYGPLGWLLAYGIAGHHAGLANGSGFEGERVALDIRLSDQDRRLPVLETVWQHEIALPAAKDLVGPGPFLARAPHKNFHLGFLVRMLFSALVDADYLDTERYYDQFQPQNQRNASQRSALAPSLPELKDVLDQYFRELGPEREIDQIRAEILAYARERANLEPGLFSLTVPTGGGKTLTSLAFALDHAIAHGQRRIIFVIPFTSIVEQNAGVFRRALGRHGEAAVLEHHSAFVAKTPDKSDPERYQAKEKLRLAMENWDAPIVVTTAVQFFESLFAARPSQCRKLHNISNSVVVLDEVQTVPLHVLRPAVAAIDELARNYRSSIVLCTATQPALEAPAFHGGLTDVRPLVRDVHDLARRLVRVRLRHVGALDDVQLAGMLREREQVLCIVNNRLHARAVYRALSDLPGTVHLSTLMCARHRSKVLADIHARLAARLPCRVVSTSLIEAGVDISFPCVMRAEAGLDSIAQAAGRCNRNGEWAVDTSEVLVFAATNPEWKPPVELLLSAQAAREVLSLYPEDPLSPLAIEAYFQKLYWQKGDAALDTAGILKTIAVSDVQRLPMERLARDFRMIKSTQQPVIVEWDDDASKAINTLRRAEKPGRSARELQPYLVQVPDKAYASLRNAGSIQPIEPQRWGEQFMELVNMDLYSEAFGLWWEEPTFMKSASMVL